MRGNEPAVIGQGAEQRIGVEQVSRLRETGGVAAIEVIAERHQYARGRNIAVVEDAALHVDR